MRRSVCRALQHSDQLLAALKEVKPAAQRVLQVHDFGASPVSYERSLQIQQQLAEKRLAGTIGDTLLQLQVSSKPATLHHASRCTMQRDAQLQPAANRQAACAKCIRRFPNA